MTDFLHGVEYVESTDGVRPIRSVRFSTAGIVGTAPDADDSITINTPVRILNARDILLFGDTGTLPRALRGFFEGGGRDIIVNVVAEGEDDEATATNVAGDIAAATGVHALPTAQALFGVQPKLICAPGFTSEGAGTAINSVVAQIKIVVAAMRAVAVVAGPNTTDAAAIAAAGFIGSDRILMVDPFGLVNDADLGVIPTDPSAHIIGGMASRPFSHSPSNKPIGGLLGPARPIVHQQSDPDSQTNLLGAANVTTIINDDGVRLWGNRGTGSDPQTAFISVRRTRDAVGVAITQAHRWAIDRNITVTLAVDVIEGVNSFIRQMKREGHVVDGGAWLNEDLNTQESLAVGRLYIDYDIAPSTPLERLTFTASVNNDYYEDLIKDVLAQT